MSDDIVARLRGFWQPHDTQSSLIDKAADEIERLRAERDEARRLYCEEWAFTIELERCETEYPPDLAAEKGWDCFKEPK